MNLSFLLTSHLVVFLLPFLLLSSAGPSPAPDPHPAIVSLPARQPPPQRHVTTTTTQPPEVEHDLLPFVLVSTIDGALHAVDREGGKVRWTLRDGVEPLVGGGIRGKGNDEEYIVEPLSGSLYVFEEENEGQGETPKIRKLPLSVEQLIELSPFTFPHSPSRIFTGSKHTSLLTLDLRTGQQLDCFSSLSGNSSNAEDDCMCENEQLLDDLEGKGRSNKDLLFVGRTDYRLTIHSPPSSSSGLDAPSTATGRAGSERRGTGAQEISYSTYTPNTYDRPLAEHWAKAGLAEQLWEEDGAKSRRTRVELGHDGAAVGVEQGGGVKWVIGLGSVGIAVYDVLLPLSPASANPILVPQPPPHLPSLFPLPADPHRSQLDLLSKPPTTYIGAVPYPPALPPPNTSSNDLELDVKTGQTTSADAASPRPTAARPSKPLLYALSSTSYPLINFAPPPRPGSLSNGSFVLSEDLPERDQLLPYLLDPPAEAMAVTPAIEGAPTERPRLREKPNAGKGWVWWVMGVLATLVLCGIAAVGFNKRPREKQSVSPANEKTPLLADIRPKSESERTVTFVEPVVATSSSAANGGAIVDDGATPKKKSTRRRVRGKKKKKDDSASTAGEGDDDGDEEEKAEGSGSGSGSPLNAEGEKPLPDLPREMSSTNLQDQEDKERLAISDTIVGYGSHGTVVLKGTWGGRPVAVKRLLSDFTRLASQEVKLLQASDDHPNVIRYYCQEKRDNFLYIALDLCQASLADLIEAPDRHLELASALDRKKALSQVTLGLKHLHGMKIIHRDIKPQNVLVSQLKDGSLRMLVSDFGLARRLEQDQSSFAPTANNLAGSLGWRAPECIRGQVRLNEGFDRASSWSSSSNGSSSSLLDLLDTDDKDGNGNPATASRNRNHARLTKAVDLFALGCLYFWVLMSGEHPFGETYNRESNIVKGEAVNMSQLDILGEEGWEAKELIGRLLEMDPEDRPDTSECLQHPFFWTSAKRLAFLCDASDRFEIMETVPPEQTLVMLETGAVTVVGKDWFSRADKVFTSNLGKYRKYKGNSVRDLLRAMRNKKHHYQDLEPAAKRHLGTLPAGFLNYFTSRYPTLFLHVHKVIRESRLQKEPMFDQYFQEGG